MNRDELKSILPHREPMLLIDEAYIGDDGIAYGTSHIRGDECFCRGIFRMNP